MQLTISYYILSGTAAALLFVFGLLFFLMRAHTKLKRDFVGLRNLLVRQGYDLAGVCAAGVNVDRLLIDHDQRLRDCLERIESLSAWDETKHPYQAAIEKIRKGAKAEELVADFGLSLSEASLLTRLHSFSGQPLEGCEKP